MKLYYIYIILAFFPFGRSEELAQEERLFSFPFLDSVVMQASRGERQAGAEEVTFRVNS